MSTIAKEADLAGPGVGDYAELEQVLPGRLRAAALAARDNGGAVRREAA